MYPKTDPSNLSQLRFQTFTYFQIIFQVFLGRSCFFVTRENQWWPLFPPNQELRPHHFSDFFKKNANHLVYLRHKFKDLQREKRSIIGRFGDYTDFFTPVLFQGQCKGFLVSGPVLDKYPTPEILRSHWKTWTGSEGSDLDHDFLHYVRVALNTPILDEEGLRGCIQVMELLARFMTEPEVPDLLDELNRLKLDVFARQIPHPYWVNWAIGIDKFFSKPEKGYVIPQWTKEEVGIERVPTVVAALMPVKPGSQTGPLEVLCLAKKFQRECFLATREMRECAAYPLGDYGAIVVTSPEPGQSRAQAWTEIREKIQSICKTLDHSLNATILAGIGSPVPTGGSLAKSYHEAVTSLHSSISVGRTLQFSKPTFSEKKSAPKILELIRNLAFSLSRSSSSRLALDRERFINTLLYNGYGPEILRANMLSALYILLDQFERRSGVGQSTTANLATDLVDRLENANTIPDLVGVFRESIDMLVRYQNKPQEASVAARLKGIINDIGKNPNFPWNLTKLSQKAELSRPTFLKWFKKISGFSYGPYLRNIRLSKAKDLLREGNLTLERIAVDCGFASASSFSNIFRRVYGTSPRKYQRKS